MDHAQWDNAVADGLHFLEHSVLQVPFFLMTLMRYITPTLDQMFMDSLRWVDQTYIQKHKSEDPRNLRAMYYPNLNMYPTHAPKNEAQTPLKQAITAFAIRYGRKAGISLAVLALSYVPYIGRFVLPAASFYTFQKSVGPQPAVAIFAVSLLMPRRYLVSFLQSYFSSRTLMRELVRTTHTTLNSTDPSPVGALLFSRALHEGAETTMVQGPSRRVVWLWTWFLRVCQDTIGWSSSLRSSGSINGLFDYQDN